MTRRLQNYLNQLSKYKKCLIQFCFKVMQRAQNHSIQKRNLYNLDLQRFRRVQLLLKKLKLCHLKVKNWQKIFVISSVLRKEVTSKKEKQNILRRCKALISMTSTTSIQKLFNKRIKVLSKRQKHIMTCIMSVWQCKSLLRK